MLGGSVWQAQAAAVLAALRESPATRLALRELVLREEAVPGSALGGPRLRRVLPARTFLARKP